MTLPYKPVSVQAGQPITDDLLNTMANNDQWLFENAPRMQYDARGVRKNTGIKIIAGIALCPPSTTTMTSKAVYLGSFFSVGCTPVVVATVCYGAGRTRFEVIVKGIGQDWPDHRGFAVAVTSDEYSMSVNKMTSGAAVNWIAVGW